MDLGVHMVGGSTREGRMPGTRWHPSWKHRPDGEKGLAFAFRQTCFWVPALSPTCCGSAGDFVLLCKTGEDRFLPRVAGSLPDIGVVPLGTSSSCSQLS